MLTPSSLACRLVPSGLRTLSKGWGLLSPGPAAYGTLLDTGGAAALGEESWTSTGIRTDKRGAGPARPTEGKGPDRLRAWGRRRGAVEGDGQSGRRGQGEAVACWGGTPEARTAKQWGFDGGLWTEADGVCPFQGSVESRWALLPES